MKKLAFALLFCLPAAHANVCNQYSGKPLFIGAIETVATRMQYSYEELCTHPRVQDIFIKNTDIINQQGEVIPHVWLTIHYSEYSCQYFLKTDGLTLTKSNCYNTW